MRQGVGGRVRLYVSRRNFAEHGIIRAAELAQFDGFIGVDGDILKALLLNDGAQLRPLHDGINPTGVQRHDKLFGHNFGDFLLVVTRYVFQRHNRHDFTRRRAD